MTENSEVSLRPSSAGEPGLNRVRVFEHPKSEVDEAPPTGPRKGPHEEGGLNKAALMSNGPWSGAGVV